MIMLVIGLVLGFLTSATATAVKLKRNPRLHAMWVGVRKVMK